jgi:hypothetical protein
MREGIRVTQQARRGARVAGVDCGEVIGADMPGEPGRDGSLNEPGKAVGVRAVESSAVGAGCGPMAADHRRHAVCRLVRADPCTVGAAEGVTPQARHEPAQIGGNSYCHTCRERRGRRIGDGYGDRLAQARIECDALVAVQRQLWLNQQSTGGVCAQYGAGDRVVALGQPQRGGGGVGDHVPGERVRPYDEGEEVVARRARTIDVRERQVEAFRLLVDRDWRTHELAADGRGQVAGEGTLIGAEAGVCGHGGRSVATGGNGQLRCAHGEHAARRRLAVRPGGLHGEVEHHRRRARVVVGDGPADRLVIVVGPGLLAERDAGWVRGDLLPDRAGHVDPSGALPVHAGRDRVGGGGHQRRLEQLPRPVGVPLGEDRRRAGDVRGSHRRAGQGDVGVAGVTQEAIAAAGGGDVDTRCGDVRFDGEVTGPWPPAGEVRQRVVGVDRTDRQGGVGARRRADRAVRAVITRRDHEQCAVLRAEVLHRLLDRIDLRRVPSAEAHVDHRGVPVRDRPLHAGEDRRLRTTIRETDLAADQVRVRCHALVSAARGRAATGDRGSHMGAVSDLVSAVFVLRDEVILGGHPPNQVGMVAVDARVQHGDGHPGTGVARLPGRRRADLRDADIQRGPA